MYHLTVTKNGEDVVRRLPFDDYAAAIAFTSRYYQPKGNRSVLSLTTEIVNGQFARSFGTLTRPEALDEQGPFFREKYHVAAKQSNSFEYDGSYLFLVESDLGIQDAQTMQAAFEDDQ